MKEYGKGILFLSKEKIEIDTGLSEKDATQAKLLQNLSEEGIIISSNNDKTFSFAPYNFTSTETKIAAGRKTESIFVSGTGYEGTPLSDLLCVDEMLSTSKPGWLQKEANKETKEYYNNLISKLNFLNNVVEYANENNISIPNIGPLGTIFGTDGTILILPQTIFIRSIESLGSSLFSKYYGWWNNQGLDGLNKWRFTLTTYAYSLFSNVAPFLKTDQHERNLDKINKNFLPLKWICKVQKNKAIDALNIDDLFNAITKNLSCPLPEHAKTRKSNVVIYKY